MSTDLPNLKLELVASLRSNDAHHLRKPRILLLYGSTRDTLSAACWLRSLRACLNTLVRKRASSTHQDYLCPTMLR